ncbi:hypothetical protein AB0D32_06605 [Micromonospora sp. NPDC048170]|uniref:hypothetical protein n=1 Tax=Micromonospora sp. NPDC048170 TaxID=3154819 RepID=UPI003403A380
MTGTGVTDAPVPPTPRPRLTDGLVVVPLPDGLLVEGGPSRQRFTGTAATELLPRLMGLLDGRRGPAELAAELGLAPGQVARAVALLDRSGLLEFGDDPGAAAGAIAGSPMRSFVSRSVALTRRHRNATAVTAVLADCVVAVHGPVDLAVALVDDLRDTGVGTIHLWDADTHADVDADCGDLLAGLAHHASRLVVAVDTDPASFRRLAERCRDSGIPLLRVGGAPGQIELGPLFTGPETACAPCFRTAREAAGWPVDAVPAGGTTLAAGMAAAEALAVLTGLTRPTTYRTVVRIHLPELRSERFDVTPEPGCTRCGLRSAPASGDLALAHEWLARPAPPSVPPAPASPADGDDTGQRGDLASSPRVRPDEAAAGLPTGLAPLLAAVAGHPAVDTYLLAVAGSAHPVHRYDPASAELVATRADLSPPPPLPDGLPADPAAVLVLVGLPGKLFRSRKDAAYREIHLETGRALARLVAAATGGPLRAVVTTGTDPRLADLLELRTGQELPTAVVGLYREDDRADLR